MSFKLTELCVEMTLREGLQAMRNSIGTSSDQIDDIFSELTAPYLNKNYGESELEKIKHLVQAPIKITHGWSDQNDIKVPEITINLTSANETEAHAGIEDYAGHIDEVLESTVLVDLFDCDSYSDITGTIICTTSNPDLTTVRTGNILVDSDGNEFKILGGITNDTGDKHFAISTGQVVNLTGCKIRTAYSGTRTTVRGVRETESILIGIITENPLATKYLFHIVKYILLSRKNDLLARGLEISTYDASDFIKWGELPQAFIRSLTLRARFIENTWNADKVGILENINNHIGVNSERPADEEYSVVQCSTMNIDLE